MPQQDAAASMATGTMAMPATPSAGVSAGPLRHGRGRLVDYNHIKATKLVLMVPKCFPNHPFDSVSRARLATLFF